MVPNALVYTAVPYPAVAHADVQNSGVSHAAVPNTDLPHADVANAGVEKTNVADANIIGNRCKDGINQWADANFNFDSVFERKADGDVGDISDGDAKDSSDQVHMKAMAMLMTPNFIEPHFERA